MSHWLDIVGIGEDGLAGLSVAAREALERAEVIIGGDRHHHLAPGIDAERLRWPHPFDALIDQLEARRNQRLVILATGDPLWFSVGARIARAIDPAGIRYHPQLSAFQWAACRLGWSLADVETLTAHGRPAAQVVPYFWPGACLLILTAGSETAGEIARLLAARGYGASKMSVLGNLGADDESRHDGIAADWADNDPSARLPAFNTLAVTCAGNPCPLLSRLPGLPDDAFVHDGLITKRAVRAVTLSRLMPSRNALLWDIGSGAASVAIEWMRAAPGARAIGIDPNIRRHEMARQNAIELGVPKLELIYGAAPDALDGLAQPDAVFIGGGLSATVVDRALTALPAGGRLVANAVTLERDAVLTEMHARHGGELTRLEISAAAPVGGLTGWRPAMPVTQWALER